MPFLVTRPTRHDQADLRKNVQRLAEYHSAATRRERKRHGEQDHQWIDEALELRGEHQVDQQQRQREHQPSDEALSSNRARSGKRCREALVESRSGNLAECGDALGQSGPGTSVPDTVAAD
jgi:hypothetical protein